jgi:hypothetical protein
LFPGGNFPVNFFIALILRLNLTDVKPELLIKAREISIFDTVKVPVMAESAESGCVV